MYPKSKIVAIIYVMLAITLPFMTPFFKDAPNVSPVVLALILALVCLESYGRRMAALPLFYAGGYFLSLFGANWIAVCYLVALGATLALFSSFGKYGREADKIDEN